MYKSLVSSGIMETTSRENIPDISQSSPDSGSGEAMEFEVVPEQSLRNEHIDLMLGTPINQVIVALQNNSRLIKAVEVYSSSTISITQCAIYFQLLYCNREPFEKDVTITLRNEGIRLYFEPQSQLLKVCIIA